MAKQEEQSRGLGGGHEYCGVGEQGAPAEVGVYLLAGEVRVPVKNGGHDGRLPAAWHCLTHAGC